MNVPQKRITPKPVTNPHKKSIHTVKYLHQPQIRLILHGGAYTHQDRNTFKNAAGVLYEEYITIDHEKYDIHTPHAIDPHGKKDVIFMINSQRSDSIHSLDIITHGGPDDIYMVSIRDEKDPLPGGKYNPINQAFRN